ncbi:unnamed protein product [Aphanomyces euteiches]
MHAGKDTRLLGQHWSYREALSPSAKFEEDIFYKSGITQEMILQSQMNHESLHQIYSTVFTKENIQKLGFRNLVKQIRSRLGKTTQVPTCEIRLRHVDYTAVVGASESQIRTLASTFQLPTFTRNHKHTKYILKNINAIFKPGTMTLVLGPPGCGKTTLLKHLAGILHVKGKEKLAGSITYNGCKPNQVDLSSLAAYVQQTDNHFPTLTVKETFEFSHKCLVGKIDPNDPLAVNEQHMVDILISVFGLTECADTITGDEMTRGVSGGQKRRVTVGEMMTGRATTLLLDEFSNGLDASTTYDIAKAVKTMVDVLEKTVVMTMLQPPPEVYDLFDNILVLDKGQVVYNGPRTHLPAYFRTIGYECPPRKDIADFLQEVTTPLGSRFESDREMAKHTRRPKTASDFAARFRESIVFQSLMHELNEPERHIWNLPKVQPSKVTLGYMDSLAVVLGRTWKSSIRDVRFNRSRMLQALVLGSIIGTVFINIGRHSNPSEERKYVPIKVSLFFLALLFQALATLSTIESGIARRQVLYKQSAFHFFYISTYALAEAMVELVWTIPQVFLFSTPLYFGVGLHNAASSYLIFVAVLYLSAITYAQFFKLFTAISPDAVLAKVLALFAFFLHVVFSGYILPQDKIPNGWIWLYWTNPFAWGLRAIAQNEFLSTTALYDTLLPVVGTDATVRLGDTALQAYGMSTNHAYVGGAIVFLASAFAVLLGLTTFAYAYVRIRQPFAPIDDKLRFVSDMAKSTSLNMPGLNSLAFEPVALSFSDLSYTIDVSKTEKRQLLQGVHGFFQPGTLTALMGSTGAGKTTLMDVIAGRKTAGVIDGNMFVNGHLLDRKTFNGVSGYCEQTDMHEVTSTVREAFLFSAALRLPSETTREQRWMFVDDILDVLELKAKAHAQYSTLSQGERKRVTIGVELLSNPSILFLDEPTTGLDSRAATIVMECVKRIAESGRTVICTIHQPSTVLFELFDRLLLLKSGGQMVYFGDLGPQSAHLLAYFGQFDRLPPIAADENPATYMLNCIGAGTGGANTDMDFAVAYSQSGLGKQNESWIAQMAHPHGARLSKAKTFETPFLQQFVLLLQRQWTIYWRSPSYNVSRFVLMLVVPLIFGSCFSGMPIKTNMDVVSQMALVFMSTTFICIAMLTTAIPFVSRTRSVFYREKLSEMYAPLAHSLSLALVELLYAIVLSLVFFNVFYWLCGLSHVTEAWLWFWASLVTSMALWSYMGHLLVYGMPTQQVAVLLAGGFASLLFVFSGFLIDGKTLSKGWQWMYWISPMHYMLELIIMAQFHGERTLVVDELTRGKVTKEDFVMAFFNQAFSFDNLWRDLALLWLTILVIQALILTCLAKVNHMKR